MCWGAACATGLAGGGGRESNLSADLRRRTYVKALAHSRHDGGNRVRQTIRISAAAGIASALITFPFGLLHPKGTTEVGSVNEWMTRVHDSDVWILVHFMLIWSSVLALVALIGIARSYEEQVAGWARIGVVLGCDYDGNRDPYLPD